MQDKNKEDLIQSAAIKLALESEMNFKLYSYRIVNKIDFIQATNEIIQDYQKILSENPLIEPDTQQLDELPY